jgi:hypothetical protein
VTGGSALVAAATGAPGVGFQILLLLHVICAVGGFGGVIYRAFALDSARRKGEAATAGVLAVYGQVSSVAEVLIYGALVFGAGAVAADHGNPSFHKPWVPIAVGCYVVMVGVLHGMVRPSERRYRATLLELAQAPAVAPPGRPPQLAELDRLYRRLGAGMGIFNVVLVAALYLMVFKP